MVDPLTKDIYIVSKEGTSKVYRAAYPQSTTGKTDVRAGRETALGDGDGG